MDHRQGLRAVPAPEGAPAQSRQPALRRRAADAGDRPGAGAQSAHCCCSTSRSKGWRRSSSRNCSRRCAASSATKGFRRSWSSRARARRSALADRAVILERGVVMHEATSAALAADAATLGALSRRLGCRAAPGGTGIDGCSRRRNHHQVRVDGGSGCGSLPAERCSEAAVAGPKTRAFGNRPMRSRPGRIPMKTSIRIAFAAVAGADGPAGRGAGYRQNRSHPAAERAVRADRTADRGRRPTSTCSTTARPLPARRSS